MLTTEIKSYIEKSVLCWLATSMDGQPNVSPKEIFTYYGDSLIIIANIASPGSVKNIKLNPKVCLSFIDILIQKGYQLKGQAKIIKKGEPEYLIYGSLLTKMTGDLYPFSSIIAIEIESAKQILAPSYMLYPSVTEEEKAEQAKRTYGLK